MVRGLVQLCLRNLCWITDGVILVWIWCQWMLLTRMCHRLTFAACICSLSTAVTLKKQTRALCSIYQLSCHSLAKWWFYYILALMAFNCWSAAKQHRSRSFDDCSHSPIYDSQFAQVGDLIDSYCLGIVCCISFAVGFHVRHQASHYRFTEW